jgi:hypothetical protein
VAIAQVNGILSCLNRDSSVVNDKQCKAMIALAIGIIVTVAGIFLLLAAVQVLPKSINVISQWEIGGKVVGALVIGLGMIIAGYGIYCKYSSTSQKKLSTHSTNIHESMGHTERQSETGAQISETPAEVIPTTHKPVAQESHVNTLSANLQDKTSLTCVGWGKRRTVYKVNNTNLAIKSPFRKGGIIFMSLTQHECIMFEISKMLEFGVVPATQYVVPGSEEANIIVTRCPTLEQPILLQQYVDPGRNVPLHIEQAHKAIIFTWVTGRSDTKKENSVIDADGKVLEVDNELVFEILENRFGSKGEPFYQESHWLLNEPEANVPIANSLLNWVLNLPDRIELNKTSLPEQFVVERIYFVENLFARNLKLLKTAIRNLQEEAVTFELLKCEINRLRELQN